MIEKIIEFLADVTSDMEDINFVAYIIWSIITGPAALILVPIQCIINKKEKG